MTRLNRVLVVVLILQLIIAAIVILPRTTTGGATEAGALLPGVEAEHVTGLKLTDADGITVNLAKVAGNWVLADADDYPVQEETVSEMLDKILAIKTDRLVTETSGSHKRLKVTADEFERLVKVGLDDGTQHSFYIGSSPSFGVAHVRAEGDDKVYLTAELSAQDARTEATAWADRIYFEVPEEEVVSLTLENEQGRFEFLKDGENWTLQGLVDGEVLNDASINVILNRATSVPMQRPLGKEEEAEYGLDSPSAVVVLQTRSEEGGDQTYTLTIGAQDPEDESYVLISSESPYYVRVAGFSVRDLVEKARDDFLVQPTATPEATPEG